MTDHQKHSAMDYPAHRATFSGFIRLIKAVVSVAIIFLILYYIFVIN